MTISSHLIPSTNTLWVHLAFLFFLKHHCVCTAQVPLVLLISDWVGICQAGKNGKDSLGMRKVMVSCHSHSLNIPLFPVAQTVSNKPTLLVRLIAKFSFSALQNQSGYREPLPPAQFISAFWCLHHLWDKSHHSSNACVCNLFSASISLNMLLCQYLCTFCLLYMLTEMEFAGFLFLILCCCMIFYRKKGNKTLKQYYSSKIIFLSFESPNY